MAHRLLSGNSHYVYQPMDFFMKKSHRFLCSMLTWIYVFSFHCNHGQSMELPSLEKATVTFQDEEKPFSEAHKRIQNYFRLHIHKHPEVIHDENSGKRKGFTVQLVSFKQELEVWQTQSILLRSDTMCDYNDLLKTLLELPQHYILIHEIAKSYKCVEFENYLIQIKTQWETGKHFHHDASQVNIFEQQKAVLDKIKKDVRDMPISYLNKLKTFEENPYFIEQTHNMLTKVITFLSAHQKFIDLLEQERLDFITLCQFLYPAPCKSTYEHIVILDDLALSYKKALKPIPPLPNSLLVEEGKKKKEIKKKDRDKGKGLPQKRKPKEISKSDSPTEIKERHKIKPKTKSADLVDTYLSKVTASSLTLIPTDPEDLERLYAPYKDTSSKPKRSKVPPLIGVTDLSRKPSTSTSSKSPKKKDSPHSPKKSPGSSLSGDSPKYHYSLLPSSDRGDAADTTTTFIVKRKLPRGASHGKISLPVNEEEGK